MNTLSSKRSAPRLAMLTTSTLTLALCLTTLASPVWGGVAVESDPVVVGQQTQVVVTGDDGPMAETQVKVTYYPNSKLERTIEVGKTDAEGKVAWSPEMAGLAKLDAGKEGGSLSLGVRFDGLPISGLIVFLCAAAMLFGGTLFGSLQLLKGQSSDPA